MDRSQEEAIRSGVNEAENGKSPSAAHSPEAGLARFEVLAGWSSQDYGGRLVLRTETFAGPGAGQREDLIHTHIFMTRDRTTLLANYLFMITGQSKPDPRRGRRKRLGWF